MTLLHGLGFLCDASAPYPWSVPPGVPDILARNRSIICRSATQHYTVIIMTEADIDIKSLELWKTTDPELEIFESTRAEEQNLQHLRKINLIGVEKARLELYRITDYFEIWKAQGLDPTTQYRNVFMIGKEGLDMERAAEAYANQYIGFHLTDRRILAKDLKGSNFFDAIANKVKAEIRGRTHSTIIITDLHLLPVDFTDPHILDMLRRGLKNILQVSRPRCTFVITGEASTISLIQDALTVEVPFKIHFENHGQNEIHLLLNAYMQKKFGHRAVFEGGSGGKYMKLLAKRIAARRNEPDFRNAKEVEDVVEIVHGRQTRRIQKLMASVYLTKESHSPNQFLFTKEDLLGVCPDVSLENCKAWKALEAMAGLENVKKSIEAIAKAVITNYRRELDGLAPLSTSTCRLFLGPPGTGKTTVAQLYGEILRELGVLSDGEVVVHGAGDFIGQYVGQSEQQTRDILERTKGKCLLIDEAYMLNPKRGNSDHVDTFRQGAIDTLVSTVHNAPGEDRCVILAGYKAEMEELFQQANPGLARRFPLEDAFVFENFDDKQLLDVLNSKLAKQGIQATKNAKNAAMEMLKLARNKPNFGNGGEVENLLTRAKARWQARQPEGENAENILLSNADFNPSLKSDKNGKEDISALFDGFVGFESTIALFKQYQARVLGMRRMEKDPRPYIPFTFIFSGPPGCGKTVTARKIGQVYKSLGLLASDDVVECSAKDMVAGYVGQTAQKVADLMQRAAGKVLFIDEAYALAQGSFAKEAIDELVAGLTKPEYQSKMIVVMAGYEQDMDELLAVNAGLASRFETRVKFQSLKANACWALLQSKMKAEDVEIPALLARQELGIAIAFKRLSETPAFGSARDVGLIARELVGQAYEALGVEGSDLSVPSVDGETILRTIEKLIKSRTPTPRLSIKVPTGSA